jgi:hypothetical protein
MARRIAVERSKARTTKKPVADSTSLHAWSRVRPKRLRRGRRLAAKRPSAMPARRPRRSVPSVRRSWPAASRLRPVT